MESASAEEGASRPAAPRRSLSRKSYIEVDSDSDSKGEHAVRAAKVEDPAPPAEPSAGPPPPEAPAAAQEPAAAPEPEAPPPAAVPQAETAARATAALAPPQSALVREASPDVPSETSLGLSREASPPPPSPRSRATIHFGPEPAKSPRVPRQSGLSTRGRSLALKIQSGTLCFATVPPEAPDDISLAVFASCSSWGRIGVLSEGQQVVAAGPPEEADGYTMVPIRPHGAVDIAVLQLEPVRHTRTTRKTMRRSTIMEAALQLHARSGAACDPMGDLPGERVLATALGMGGSAPGTAVADAEVPSSSSTPLPVQVDVTNYRLRLLAPDITGANLNVMVCCGQGLVATDRNAPPDPFAVISLVGHRHRSLAHPRQTTVKTKTADPVWNEVFTFEGVSDQAILRVQLFDAGRSRGEDYMGEVQVRKVARMHASGQSSTRQWAVTLGVQYGDLDVIQVGDAPPRLGTLRLLLRCTWPTPGPSRSHCSFPLLCIEKVSLDPKTQRLSVATKATEQFCLHFDTAKDANEIHWRLANEPQNVQSLVCMSGSSVPRPDPEWRFDLHRELERWTTREATSMRRSSPDDYMQRWRVDAEVNKGYRLCSTYPEEVILPTALSLKTLRASANFRTRNRFPMISWVHPCNGAVLVRCSQPMVGSNINKDVAAKHDRECLMAFASGESRELTICDARPYKNAQANRVGGGGTETSLSYESCNVQFLDIENIHVMREDLHGLRAAVCQQDDYSMYAGALTKWLNHLRSLIRGANTAAEMVESGMSVVVHCSDGWDRTSQIISLASILLDGHYRTIRGLIDLIQKDWLLPGHKFRDRNGLAARKEQSQHQNEMSPIFLQFLDALSQVWSTYPRHFEYTPQLLSFLLYHSLSGRYSNFLCNCEKEREEAGLFEAGSCLWTEIMDSDFEWINQVYDEELAREPIVPCVIPLQQHGFSRDLYVGFSTWWSDESRPAVSTSPHSFMSSVPSVLEARTVVRSTPVGRTGPLSQQENGGYIFCSSRLHHVGISKMLACELLLRKFMGVATFPAQPVVRVVSHMEHSAYTQFVIEMSSDEGDEMHYVTKRYVEFEALRLALKEQVGLVATAHFPPKTFFGMRCKGRDLEERLLGLNLWLSSVIATAWVLPEEEETQAAEAERCWDEWLARIRMLLPALDERQPLRRQQASERRGSGASVEMTQRHSVAR